MGILALDLGCGWMLVGLEKYCQCKLKGTQEAMYRAITVMKVVFEDGEGVLVMQWHTVWQYGLL